MSPLHLGGSPPFSSVRVVVQEVDLVGLGVRLDHLVQVADLLRGLDFGPPAELRRGGYRAEDDLDAVGLCQLAHRDYIAQRVFGRDVTVVLGHGVGARENHDGLGLEVDHVAAEAHEHLGRCLAADAAPHEVVLGEEVGIHARPVVGDGVAHEYYVGRLFDCGVGLGVTAEVGPILLLCCGAYGRGNQYD